MNNVEMKEMKVNQDRLYDMSCTVCMDDFVVDDLILVTPCNHSFHPNCLNGWIDKKIDDKFKNI